MFLNNMMCSVTSRTDTITSHERSTTGGSSNGSVVEAGATVENETTAGPGDPGNTVGRASLISSSTSHSSSSSSASSTTHSSAVSSLSWSSCSSLEQTPPESRDRPEEDDDGMGEKLARKSRIRPPVVLIVYSTPPDQDESNDDDDCGDGKNAPLSLSSSSSLEARDTNNHNYTTATITTSPPPVSTNITTDNAVDKCRITTHRKICDCGAENHPNDSCHAATTTMGTGRTASNIINERDKKGSNKVQSNVIKQPENMNDGMVQSIQFNYSSGRQHRRASWMGPNTSTLPPMVKRRGSCAAGSVSHQQTTTAVVAPIRRTTLGNVNVPWMEDARLIRSKVYWSRFHSCTIRLQAFIRRYQQRHTLESKRKEQIRAARDTSWNQSATRIQAMVRGYVARLHVRVQTLQRQLHSLNERWRGEMDAITEWKQDQEALIWKKCLRKQRKQERKLARIEKIISSLRKKNKKYRKRNEKLHESCQEMTERNRILVSALAALQRDIQFVQENNEVLEQQHEQMQHILSEMKKREDIYLAKLERYDDAVAFETTVAYLMRRTVEDVVWSVRHSTKCSPGMVSDIVQMSQPKIC